MKNKPKDLTPMQALAIQVDMDMKHIRQQFQSYSAHLNVSQNIILALARSLKLNPSLFGKAISENHSNKEYEKDLIKEISRVSEKHKKEIAEIQLSTETDKSEFLK